MIVYDGVYLVTYTFSFYQAGDDQLYIITVAVFIFLTSHADEERRRNDGTSSFEDRIKGRKMHKRKNFVTVYSLPTGSALSE